jgi:hypothetical protein
MARSTRLLGRTIAVLLVFSLVSCLDVISEFRLNEDGSGRMSLTYTVSKSLLHMGTTDEKDKFYALPVSREDFEESVSAIDGLSLSSYDISEEADVYQIESELAFRSIEALAGFFSASGPGTVGLDNNGDSTVFRYVIFAGNEAPVDEESVRLIESLFGEYTAAFSLRAPSDVRSVTGGTFSGRNASVEFATADIMVSGEPVVWEVRW